MRLGFGHVAPIFGDLVEEGVRQKQTPHEVLYDVLDAELAFRHERRVGTSLKLSGLPPGKTMESFDFAFQPRVGKTRLAAAFGAKAVLNGFCVASCCWTW